MARQKPIVSRPDPLSDGEAVPFDLALDANAPAETGPPPDRTTDAEPPGAADAPAGPDPFDPASLRLTQDFAVGVGVKRVHLTIPVRKPEKTWFVRAHPDEAYRLQTAMIEMKDERGEIYAVARELWPELAAEVAFRPKLLATAINRQGVVFLWPLNLPNQDGRVDEWTRTGLEALQLAMKGWVRVVPNMTVGGYEVAQPTATLSEPEWPDMPLRELLRIAFRERLIKTLDHPILRRLRGEV
jgi:hypothetical protein